MSPPSILILALGNPSRGDDALGPELLARLQLARVAAEVRLELIGDFQLQIEHALDLRQRHLVLFVDAAVRQASGLRLRPVEAEVDASYSTHAMTPGAVLAVWQRIETAPPPPCFLLTIKGEGFALGEGLSDLAQARLEAALGVVMDLLEQPHLAYWQQCAATGDVPPALEFCA